MARKKKARRFRRLRTDHRHHRKHAGLCMVARDLWLQAIEATPLGVLEGSIRKLAVACGPIHAQGKRPTDRQIKAALAQLTAPRGPKDKPIAMWWPDLETLWVIEAADEQVMNTSMWLGLREEIAALPTEVREAVLVRYAKDIAAAESTDTAADTPAPHSGGHSGPPSGDTVTPHPSVQRQRQDQTQVSGAAPGPSGPPVLGHSLGGWAHDWHYRWQSLKSELGKPHLQNPVTATGEKADGLARALSDQGPAVVEQVIEHTARRVAAGDLKPALLGRMFVGDGFGARLADWAEHQDEQERREKQRAQQQGRRRPLPGLQSQGAAGPPVAESPLASLMGVDPDEFYPANTPEESCS